MSTGEHDNESPITTADELEHSQDETSKRKLELDVQSLDIGPCRKRLKVAIPRPEIERQFDESFGELKREAVVPGFRPGHAPRQLVERRFRKQVADQVKSSLLVSTLEQLDADYKLNPISQPKLDLAAIALPDDGPMQFEMEVEVRPEFELPAYKALSVKRPSKTLTEDDVTTQVKLFLERYAQMVPKLEGGAEIGDYITADLKFVRDGNQLNEAKELQFRLQPEIRFQDGTIPKVGEVLRGVKPGETREAEARIGSGSADPSLRGQAITVSFQVHDLKQLRLPEITPAFLSGIGFDGEEDLRGAVREILERRLKNQQLQAVRREILGQLLKETPFDLPADLVKRQEKDTIRRLVMDLRREGLNDDEIRARQADIRANAHEATLQGLKEFFLLAKIAEAEEIKVEDDDLAIEIEMIAARSDESPRRVRARIEKEGTADAIASQILERKTIERILEYVSYEEVPLVEQEAVETLDQTATTMIAEEEAPESGETPAAEEAATDAPSPEGDAPG